MTDIWGYAYAATVAAGGIVGYVKAGSIPSLGAGLLFGTILGYGAHQISQDASNYAVSLGTSAVLGGMMGYRFYNSGRSIIKKKKKKKFMPAGLVCVLSVAMVAKLLISNAGMTGVKT